MDPQQFPKAVVHYIHYGEGYISFFRKGRIIEFVKILCICFIRFNFLDLINLIMLGYPTTKSAILRFVERGEEEIVETSTNVNFLFYVLHL